MLRIGGALLVALALLGAGCSGGGEDRAEPATSSQRLELPSEQILVTEADIVSAKEPLRPLDDGVRSQVQETVRAIFTATTADPLVKGLAGEIAPHFTPEALAVAVGPGRPALFDEGVAPVSSLRVRSGAVRLRALEHEGGAPAMVVAVLDWHVLGPRRSVEVRRTGELVLVPRDDRWQVESFGVTVTRTVAGVVTTTSSSTPGPAS